MKWIERIKTVLFVGLFLSSAILTVIYIADIPVRQSTVGGNLPADVLAALRGGAAEEDVLQENQLMPAFFGLRQSGESPVGLRSGAEMMQDLDELISPWIAFALGEGSACHACTAEEGASRWRTCISANSFFYLRWDGEFSAAILRAHAMPDRTEAMLQTASGRLPQVHEIFLFPEGQTNDGVCAVSRDLAGRVTLWKRADLSAAWDSSLPDFSDFSLYQSRGVLQIFSFAGTLYPEIPSRLQSLPVPEIAIPLPALTYAYPFAEEKGTDRIPDAVLECFDYNLNKAGGYYETDTDTAVFVETHGTLRASAQQLLYEATARGGLSVRNFLAQTDTALDLRDDMIACEMLVASLRRLDRSLVGGSASPQLTSVSAEGDTLVLAYHYFYDNVRIGLNDPAIVVSIRDHAIVSVSVSAMSYFPEDEYVPAGSQRWMLQLSDYLRERDPAEDLMIALCYTPTERDGLRLVADWGLYRMP